MLIPAIAKYEWHPFTISSAPEQAGKHGKALLNYIFISTMKIDFGPSVYMVYTVEIVSLRQFLI